MWFFKITPEKVQKWKERGQVEKLIKALKVYGVRRKAVGALGEIGDKRAVEPIIELLGAYDRKVRMSAAKALGKIGDKKAVEPLIRTLRDKDELVRRNAVSALGEIVDKRAVEPLIKALGDEDEIVRGMSAKALGEIGDKRAVEPLIKALGAYNKDIHRSAAEALVKVGDEAVRLLIKALGDEYWQVRMNAANALGEIGDKRAVEPLVKVLGDEDEHVRENAAKALGELGWKPTSDKNGAVYCIYNDRFDECVKIGKPAVGPLIKALRVGNKVVHRSVVEALIKIGRVAVEPLIKALGDEGWVGEHAAYALGEIGDKRAVEPLIKALGDENKQVREHAVKVLGELGWKPTNDKERALYYISEGKFDECVKIGKPAVEPLIKVLGDEDKHVRENAAKVLGELGWKPTNDKERALYYISEGKFDECVKIGKPAVELLIKALRTRRGSFNGANGILQRMNADLLRASAASALGEIGDKRAVKPLIEALRDEDEGVRGRAAVALGEIGDKRAVKPLKNLLWSFGEKESVQMYASKALRKLGE
jgi:HEAT repeat protein